jgi:hypothetical protein
MKRNSKAARDEAAAVNRSARTAGPDKKIFFTPTKLAERWNWHPESVRRALREKRFEHLVIGGRLLVPLEEIERVEAEGRIARAA